MADEGLKWIWGSGGPLILLPEELLQSWSGLDVPQGRIVEARERWDPSGPATDYDRACDVEAAIANIDVDAGRGIILGGPPAATAFRPGPDGGLLLRWVQAENEEELIRHVEGRSFESEGEDVAMIEARPGPLILFDAACPGHEVEDDRVVIDLHPGQYLATAVSLEPDERTELVVIPLQRVG